MTKIPPTGGGRGPCSPRPSGVGSVASPTPDSLFYGYFRWALSLADRWWDSHNASSHIADRDDVRQAALIGLHDAASRWDPGGEAAFMTFATYRIVGSIRDELRAMDRLSRSQRDEQKRAQRQMREGPYNIVSLESEIKSQRVKAEGDRALTYADTLVDQEDWESNLSDRLFREFVEGLLLLLPVRMRMVLVFRYWMELTQEKTAEVLGVSPSRVSQIETAAMHRLRALLGAGREAAA